MAVNRGKAWETKIKEDFKKIPGISIDRIYDVVGQYYGVSNICDMIGYKYPYILYIEAKETRENNFNFHKLTQYDKLITKKGIKGVRAGVLLWFSLKDMVIWVPIEEVEKMKNDGCKSISLKMLDKDYKPVYNIIRIPAVKKRVFMECDYSILFKEEL